MSATAAGATDPRIMAGERRTGKDHDVITHTHHHPAAAAAPVAFAVPRAATLDVLLTGEIDFGNARAVLDHILRAIRRRRPAVVHVDLADVTYADSSALRMLVAVAAVAVDEVGASFAVRDPGPLVVRIIDVAGLSAALGLVDAVAASQPACGDRRAGR
jgi:anti-sigma B factor antagonist